MAKKKLIWYPGAMYHVTSRGNRKSDIFRDEKDYLIYRLMRKTTVPCACGCKHFKETGFNAHSL